MGKHVLLIVRHVIEGERIVFPACGDGQHNVGIARTCLHVVRLLTYEIDRAQSLYATIGVRLRLQHVLHLADNYMNIDIALFRRHAFAKSRASAMVFPCKHGIPHLGVRHNVVHRIFCIRHSVSIATHTERNQVGTAIECRVVMVKTARIASLADVAAHARNG